MDWIKSEPVRVRLYPLLVLVVGYLGIKGWADADTRELVLGAGLLILGMLGIEGARGKVSPVDPPDDELDDDDDDPFGVGYA